MLTETERDKPTYAIREKEGEREKGKEREKKR